jgi:hypothetical protein
LAARFLAPVPIAQKPQALDRYKSLNLTPNDSKLDLPAIRCLWAAEDILRVKDGTNAGAWASLQKTALPPLSIRPGVSVALKELHPTLLLECASQNPCSGVQKRSKPAFDAMIQNAPSFTPRNEMALQGSPSRPGAAGDILKIDSLGRWTSAAAATGGCLMAVEKTLRLESTKRFPLFHRHDDGY